MPKATRPLSFAEFGHQFIRQALTPELIGSTLARVVPAEQRINLLAPTPIEVHARTELGVALLEPPEAPEHELVFRVPLVIHLALTINLLVGAEQYQARANTQLRMVGRARAPLTIVVDCPPVSPEQVSVESEGSGNWFDLAKRIGGLDVTIQQQVAAMVNQQIAASQQLRTIRLRPLITRFGREHGASAPRRRARSVKAARP